MEVRLRLRAKVRAQVRAQVRARARPRVSPHRIPRVGLDGSVPLGDVLALRREVLRRALPALILELGVKCGDLALRLLHLGFVLRVSLRLVRSRRGGSAGVSFGDRPRAEVGEGPWSGERLVLGLWGGG